MKRLILLLACVLPVLAWGQYLGGGLAAKGAAATPAVVGSEPTPTYFINQNFEGVGYDNSESWTENPEASGIIDEDYTDIVLAGSQSCYLSNTAYGLYIKSPTFSDTNICFLHLMVRAGKLPAGGSEIFLCNLMYGNNSRCQLRVLANGTLRMIGNVSGTVTTAGAMSVGTTYHVWASVSTASTPESVTVGFSTDGTRPTSGDTYASGTVEITDSTVLNNIRLGNMGGGAAPNAPWCVIDRVLVAGSQIGDNP